MAKPRGILSPRPLRKVPSPPKSPGAKRIDAYMKQIRASGRKKK